MSKFYNIEGNIDFYSELYKSLDKDDNNLDDENLCLITNEPLVNLYVTLQCNHKFNYIALYNDIKNHKQKFNALEGHKSQLKSDEIRCPYCRNKQTGLLTYYEELGLPQTHGVNYIDINKKNRPVITTNYSSCKYLTLNPNYDPSGNNPIEFSPNNMGNCKFLKCFHNGYYQITKYIENYSGEDINVCYTHKKMLVKENNIMIKNKQKEEAKKLKAEIKLKEKNDKFKEKEELKIKAKEDKKITKKPVENVILGPINIVTSNDSICLEILKSGPNKGKQCGCKIYNAGYCKRHIKKEKIQNVLVYPETDVTLEIKTEIYKI
jgi:hypothetical protein